MAIGRPSWDPNTYRRSALLGSLVLVASVVFGCASPSHPRGSADHTERGHMVRFAGSPQAAALGFDRSLRSDGDIRFECIPGSSGVFSWYGEKVRGRARASVAVTGSKWIVTISYPQDETDHPRYEVRYRIGGYCVDAVLNDRQAPVTPSPPAPYSGTNVSTP